MLWDIFNSQHLGERILKDFFGRNHYWMVVVGIGQVVGNMFIHFIHSQLTHVYVGVDVSVILYYTIHC